MAMLALLGLTVALLAAMASSVAIVLPVIAIWRPDVFIKHNMMSTREEHRATNTAAVRGVAVLVPLAFVIGSLLAIPDEGSLGWWLGVVLGLVAAVLTYFVWSRQRVDHEKRARWAGLMPTGIPNPNDPPPDSDR